MKNKPLSGKNVVVTRPTRQAQELAGLIRAAGGSVILFPVIEILDVEDPRPLLALVDRLDEFDLAIFISPNAAARAMSLIAARRPLPPRLKIAAIGTGGVKELARFGVRDVIAPARRFDSEALLDLPPLRFVAGMRVVIFRGGGGREQLERTLKARGALVEYADCYRRGKTNLDAGPLLRAWSRDELDAITVTSTEALRNLFERVGVPGEAWFRKTPVFAPHLRIAEHARGLGVATVIVTGPGDDGILTGLIEHFKQRAAHERERHR